MRILLTNDDGIDAPGLAALQEAVLCFGELVVIAPDRHLSGVSHQTTTDQPLRLDEISTDRFSTNGTPADCVRLGLLKLVLEFDLVVSGVNNGGNLGVDTFMSGTVAATREAALLGKPAIAFSQYRNYGDAFDWTCVVKTVRKVTQELIAKPLDHGAFWNVNLPDPRLHDSEPLLVFCPLDQHALPVSFDDAGGQYHYKCDYHNRPRDDGADVAVCFSGNISITRIENWLASSK